MSKTLRVGRLLIQYGVFFSWLKLKVTKGTKYRKPQIFILFTKDGEIITDPKAIENAIRLDEDFTIEAEIKAKINVLEACEKADRDVEREDNCGHDSYIADELARLKQGKAKDD